MAYTDTQKLYQRIQVAAAGAIADDALISAEVLGGVNPQPATDQTNISYPCVVVTFEGSAPRKLPGDTTLRQFAFPLFAAILDQTEYKQRQEQMAKYAAWMMAITEIFDQKGRGVILGVDEVYKWTVNLRPLIDTKAAQYPNLMSAIEIIAEASVTR